MKRVHRIILTIFVVVLLVIVLGCVFNSRPVSDAGTKRERRQIADALYSMLHSSLTNEVDLNADNPAVPEVIRALHPMDIELMGRDAVILCPGTPAEYHLSSQPADPSTWILYVAGPGYDGHKEIFRMKKD